MAYTLDINIALGSSQTGLTLSAQLVDTAGANVGSAITTGFTEIGVGNYLWHYTGFPDAHRGGVKFSTTGGTLKAFVAINPEEAENLQGSLTAARAAKLDLIGTGVATVSQPVQDSGDITTIRGDAYSNTDSRSLEWTTTAATVWPTLTGASVTFTARSLTNTSELTKTATVVTSTGASKKVRVELTPSDTSSMALGPHKFDLQATLSGTTRRITLVRGVWTIKEDITTS